jgi:hypothetical protein
VTRERRVNGSVQQSCSKRRGTLRNAGSGIALVRPETSEQDSENVNGNAPLISQQLIAVAPATLVAMEVSRTGVRATESRKSTIESMEEINGLNR